MLVLLARIRPVNELILEELRKAGYVSGEKLGKKLGVSRTAVWKHINELRQKGYTIVSSPRLGYFLSKNTGLLLPEEVRLGLETNMLGKHIIHHDGVSSTQDLADELARKGADEGTAVIAEKQTRGRGRKGREWVSPAEGGVYLSVVLRPALMPNQIVPLPLVAGVAVANAIEKVTPLKPRIKWPNDIMVNGKKVAGILAEMNCEIDSVNHIILGIGINVNTPKKLLDKTSGGNATSLSHECGRGVSRVKLVQQLLYEIRRIPIPSAPG